MAKYVKFSKVTSVHCTKALRSAYNTLYYNTDLTFETFLIHPDGRVMENV